MAGNQYATTLQARIKQAVADDAWAMGTSPEDAAAILRGEAVALEQQARMKRR